MLAIYNIDDEFTELLRNNIDRRVSKNNNVNYKRAYCGIIVSQNNNRFFIPMTHKIDNKPSLKNTVFVLQKLKNGQRVRDIGMLLFNNAIPVKEGTYTMVETAIKSTDSDKEKKYKYLLQTQLAVMKKYEATINFRFNKLLERKEKGLLSKIEESRTCDFKKMVNFIDSDGFKASKLYKKLKNQAQISQLKQKETTMNAYLKSVKNGVMKPKKQNVFKKVYQKKI